MARTGSRYWINRGFLDFEASAFKNISHEAILDSRYIQIMIHTRMRRFREFYQKYPESRNTLKGFYDWVKKQYIRRGITDNPYLLNLRGSFDSRNKAKTLAFDFFNQYKDKYALRDTSGRVVKTPRKKARASKKPITGNKSIDQVIRKFQEDIRNKEFRLRYARDNADKKRQQTEIQRLKLKVKQLRIKKKK